jgi:hypothetical protein
MIARTRLSIALQYVTSRTLAETKHFFGVFFFSVRRIIHAGSNASIAQ